MGGSLDGHHGLVVSVYGMSKNDFIRSHEVVSTHHDDKQRFSYAFDIRRRAGVRRLINNPCDIVGCLIVVLGGQH